MSIPKIFIGFDPVETVCHTVLQHSLNAHASGPLMISQINLQQLNHIYWRDRHPLQSNDFSFSRWLVPYLCDYEGFAIFVDGDFVCLDDIYKLWDMRDEKYAVQVVKNKHTPDNEVKYLGTTQTKYQRKNWSSLILFNCAKCQYLSPDSINTADGLFLHQFQWLDDAEIGEIPKAWNFLVGIDNTFDCKPSMLHYTDGGPYFADYEDVEFKEEWWEAFRQSLDCEDPSDTLLNMQLSIECGGLL